MGRVAKGFTLIEVMITIAIIGVLTAVALPQYRDYVLRARLTDAFSGLAGAQPTAEQYWANGRTFEGLDARLPAPTANFTFSLTSATVSAYTITATGIGPATGFAYTINQSGTRATTVAPAAWGTSASCWVDRKGGACSQ